MITYINKENAKDYQALFSKATKVLQDNQPDNLNIENWQDFQIGSLNEYFAYLETLVNLDSLTLEQKSMFVRLPLDEDVFEINADTRAISIPSTFARYGIGVQGDEMAEVVYFTIDRFFDSMDLAGNNIKIAIQWEAKNAEKQVITGFSRNFGKEIVNIKDKNGDNRSKIVFGWPISGELTQTTGTIKFAVRFYSVDSNNKFTYSFTTLPYEITVNATLDYDMFMPETNHGETILGRIRSSGIYDPDASDIPEDPTITTQLYAIGSNDKIIDLPGNNEGVQLAISAQPTTSGVISYRWNKYSYNESTSDYADSVSPLPNTDSVRKELIEVTSNIPIDDISYFYNANGELINLATTLEETNGYYLYDEEEGGFKKDNTDDYIAIYKEFSIATVHSVGKYAVLVAARSGANTAEKESETITIPGPLKPIVRYDEQANITDNIVHIIAENNEASLPVSAITGESIKSAEEVGSAPVVTLTYNWFKGSEQISEGENEDDFIYDINEEANVSTLTIQNLPSSGLDEIYHAAVTASRNNVTTTQTSIDYRVTYAPVKPVLKYREYNGDHFVYVEKDYLTETSALPINLRTRGGEFNKIAFAVEPPAQSDKLSYVWMKANIENDVDEDWTASGLVPKLQVDVDDALPDLFVNPNGSGDIPTDGVFNLTTLNELGAIVDDEEENGPVLQLNENTTSGYYYCIVINELNNNRVANVTPFFYVQEA